MSKWLMQNMLKERNITNPIKPELFSTREFVNSSWQMRLKQFLKK